MTANSRPAFCAIFSRSVILLTAGLLANIANAAGGHEGWYQVEMIVFARRNADTEEHWPSALKLRYPSRWAELKDPSSDSPTADNDQTLDSPDLTKEPFWLLPESERSLNEQARTLERSSAYQLLFHEAWRQPVTNKRAARSIIITGGKNFGKHQELEGSITLSVATYLKVITDLWYTQFDLNIDNQESPWPEIPLRPNYTFEPAAPQLSLDQPFDPNQTPAGSVEGNIGFADAATDEEQSPYKPRRIVLINQARDMRSGEIHYLDHPLVGIIIKIVPYATEQ